MADKKPLKNNAGTFYEFEATDTVGTANGGTGVSVAGTGIGSTLVVLKKATQTITSSTSLTNDNAFSFSGVANATYRGCITFPLTANGSGGFKVDMTAPSGCTGDMSMIGLNAYTLGNTPIGTGFGATATATNAVIHIPFEIVFSSTAGTVNFRWAQNASFGTGTSVGTGILTATRTA